ncbi:hypothetical protein BT67DRAFT_191813 [Trichocladium antarcticum]|uniref:Uncharacterized protein n=1 Tax=Trichocladium antarcticum TaxID=1450529 RepID=A0AAN6ZGM5_9PEZI|nr:hypothetical protein BT67DRAFT_191813 [Trichocladium antarcticum]
MLATVGGGVGKPAIHGMQTRSSRCQCLINHAVYRVRTGGLGHSPRTVLTAEKQRKFQQPHGTFPSNPPSHHLDECHVCFETHTNVAVSRPVTRTPQLSGGANPLAIFHQSWPTIPAAPMCSLFRSPWSSNANGVQGESHLTRSSCCILKESRLCHIPGSLGRARMVLRAALTQSTAVIRPRSANGSL